MAKLYFDDQAARIWPGGIRKLPIPEVRRKLYEANVQRLIPF